MSTNPKIILTAAASIALLGANPASAQEGGEQTASSSQSPSRGPQGGLSVDLPQGITQDMLGKRSLQTIALQVMLDRSRHSPGVIDGYMGGNTRRAIRFYRQANGLPKGEGVDDALLKSLLDTQSGAVFRSYTISKDDLAQPFDNNPDDFAAMADAKSLDYESPIEMFGERFHMTEAFLRTLNPDADFGKAGTKVIIVAHGDEKLAADVSHIEVRKKDNSVLLLQSDGKLIASYPATIGSDDFPSPSGKMKVKAIVTEPAYYFDPDAQKWGPDKRIKIAPGPNNPIGGTWIDLGKEGYGIHGSPDPRLVGKRTSHGCVRLTNWDADEVAGAVSTGVPVEFT